MKQKLLNKLQQLESLADQDYPSHPKIYGSLGISKSYFYALIRKLRDEGKIEPVEGKRIETFTRFSIDTTRQGV